MRRSSGSSSTRPRFLRNSSFCLSSSTLSDAWSRYRKSDLPQDFANRRKQRHVVQRFPASLQPQHPKLAPKPNPAPLFTQTLVLEVVASQTGRVIKKSPLCQTPCSPYHYQHFWGFLRPFANMSVGGVQSSSFNDRSHWPCRWNWCNSSFITQTQLVHHINETHIQTMKPVKRRDLKAILQQEPESPSVANLSALERLADRTISTQSTTNSTQPEKTMPQTEAADPSHPDAAPQPLEASAQPDVRLNSLEPPPPPPATSGFRRFRALGGLRGETPSPAPLPPSPDVSELLFHAAGSRNLLPPQPPGSPSPTKKRPRSPAARNSSSMSRSPSPSRSRRSPLPDRVVSSPAPNAIATLSTNLTPFAKRLKVSRQTPPPPPAAALFSKSKPKTPSPQRVRVPSPSPGISQPHVTHRDPSSSPVARSAPPTTPSPSGLPEEPGSSPFPEEDEDEKEDGPGTDGEPGGSRATTGDLDELEEFYGSKASTPKDVSENNEGEQSQSQSLNLKDPFGFQTQAFPRSTLGDDSY